MTAGQSDIEPLAPSTGDASRTLYVYVSEWYDGYHLVSQASIDRAEAEHAATADAPYYENYGELRRSGDLDILAERLNEYGLTLEEYVASIERSVGKAAPQGDLAERLEAVSLVDFDGDNNTPGDDEDFRSQSELDEEIAEENVFMHVIETSMGEDVPADVLSEFGSQESPMFVEYVVDLVTEENLDAMIAALEARGYTIVRDH